MAENESQYVPDRSGRETLYVVGEAGDGLSLLAEGFPVAFRRALGRVGSLLRKELRSCLESGGAPGETWKPVSGWHPWATRSKPGRRRKNSRSRFASRDMSALKERFFGRTATGKPYGKLYGAARYILGEPGTLVVTTGWVTGSSARFGQDVQAALRGASPYNPQFSGSQPVTRSMRRALAAMGLILAKSTTTLNQPERPLMRAVYQDFEPKIQGIIEGAMAEYLEKGGRFNP